MDMPEKKPGKRLANNVRRAIFPFGHWWLSEKEIEKRRMTTDVCSLNKWDAIELIPNKKNSREGH